MSKLLYASPAGSGFDTKEDQHRIDSFKKKSFQNKFSTDEDHVLLSLGHMVSHGHVVNSHDPPSRQRSDGFPSSHHHLFNVHFLPRLIKGMDGSWLLPLNIRQTSNL